MIRFEGKKNCNQNLKQRYDKKCKNYENYYDDPVDNQIMCRDQVVFRVIIVSHVYSLVLTVSVGSALNL